MVGSVVDYRRRTGGYVGVFKTGGDGLWGDGMSDEYKHEPWEKAWEEYWRARQESVEQEAFCAGYRAAQLEMRGKNAIERSPSSGGEYGTFAWAYQQMQDGKAVMRNGWRRPITSKDRFAIGDLDVFATDWEIYWGETEAPDSPCDVP